MSKFATERSLKAHSDSLWYAAVAGTVRVNLMRLKRCRIDIYTSILLYQTSLYTLYNRVE